MRKKIVLILAALLFLMFVHYFYMGCKAPSMNNEVRKVYTKDWVELSKGATAYETANLDVEEDLVVLIHGFSIPSIIWNNTFAFLKKSGNPVLRYDLYGRGLSDRPSAKYNEIFFVEQLHELLAKVAPNRNVVLCGLSMGGAISVAYANQYSAHVKKIILIDAAGLEMPLPFIGKLLKLPLLGDYLGRLFAPLAMDRSFDSNFTTKPEESIKALSMIQIGYAGYSDAIVSTLRNMPLYGMKNEILLLSSKKIPTLILWGLRDKVIPFANAAEFKKLLPHAKLAVFENSGHVPVVDEPDLAHKKIESFLSP